MRYLKKTKLREIMSGPWKETFFSELTFAVSCADDLTSLDEPCDVSEVQLFGVIAPPRLVGSLGGNHLCPDSLGLEAPRAVVTGVVSDKTNLRECLLLQHMQHQS